MENIMEQLRQLQEKADKYDAQSVDAQGVRTKIGQAIDVLQEVYAALGVPTPDVSTPGELTPGEPTPRSTTIASVIASGLSPRSAAAHKDWDTKRSKRLVTKKRQRKKSGIIDRKVMEVIDYVNGLQSVVPWKTAQAVCRIAQGGTATAVIQRLMDTKKIKISKLGNRYILIPRGVQFKAPNGASSLYSPEKRERGRLKKQVVVVVPRKRSKTQITHAKFMSMAISKYTKIGYLPQDAFKLATNDWNRMRAGGVRQQQVTPRFPKFDCLDSDAQIIVKSIILHAMKQGTPITFEQDAPMIGIHHFNHWTQFVSEVMANNAELRKYVSDTSGKRWKYIRRHLWYQ